MTPECHPISVLPHLSKLFSEFTELRSASCDAAIRRFYPHDPFGQAWTRGWQPRYQPDRMELVGLLARQNAISGAAPEVLANLDRLRDGARAVVTGQQVGLLGGPALTLFKAATAIRKAQAASAAGIPHVPVFWMATEDHDLDEVNQTTFAAKNGVETLHLQFPGGRAREVGSIELGPDVEQIVERVEELLNFDPVCDLVRMAYKPGETLASSFARLIGVLFARFGLIVLDASDSAFHRLGAPVLRKAVENADELHELVVTRSAELVDAGYHAQVLVGPDSSLLFLVDDSGDRQPLRRVAGSDGKRQWKAGGRVYSREELLAILEHTPERLSPNALLRPVFQDAILPTSAYVAGPAEIAYFAQSAPLYQRILDGVTPVLPRLSATLIDAPTQALMEQYELTLPDALQSVDCIAAKLGARAIPIEGKRRIASAGNALDAELNEVTRWMEALSPDLGKTARISASKMRYQMNRMRRLAANWQLQKQTHLRKHAQAIGDFLFPREHPQERLLSSVQVIARSSVDLSALLVQHAEQECPGHRVFFI